MAACGRIFLDDGGTVWGPADEAEDQLPGSFDPDSLTDCVIVKINLIHFFAA